tara:strand:- start:622 stop:1011 length:390 start_codon:yes stop_codon:yes gene_type:complete
MLITNCGNSWIRDEYKDELVNAAVVWAGESNRTYIENDVEDFCEDIHSDLNELLDFEYSSPFDVDIILFGIYEGARLGGATPQEATNFYWAFDDYCRFTPRVWDFSSSWGQALTTSVQGLESLFQRYNP